MTSYDRWLEAPYANAGEAPAGVEDAMDAIVLMPDTERDPEPGRVVDYEEWEDAEADEEGRARRYGGVTLTVASLSDPRHRASFELGDFAYHYDAWVAFTRAHAERHPERRAEVRAELRGVVHVPVALHVAERVPRADPARIVLCPTCTAPRDFDDPADCPECGGTRTVVL